MNVFLKDKKIYIKDGNKVLELVSEDTLDKLNNKKLLIKKIKELTIRCMTMVSVDIGKMDLEENEKIVVQIVVMERLNSATMGALGDMCKNFGEYREDIGTEGCEEKREENININDYIKEDDETLECFTKVLKKMGRDMDKCADTLRKDIPGMDRFDTSYKEKLRRDLPIALLGMCILGKGKDASDFIEKTMTICVEETNRLGRRLTKEEVIEICEDVRLKRK